MDVYLWKNKNGKRKMSIKENCKIIIYEIRMSISSWFLYFSLKICPDEEDKIVIAKFIFSFMNRLIKKTKKQMVKKK